MPAVPLVPQQSMMNPSLMPLDASAIRKQQELASQLLNEEIYISTPDQSVSITQETRSEQNTKHRFKNFFKKI